MNSSPQTEDVANLSSFDPITASNSPYFVIGQVEQRERAALHAGATAELTVDFISDGLAKLHPGVRWALYDGPIKLIGCGTVLQVVEE